MAQKDFYITVYRLLKMLIPWWCLIAVGIIPVKPLKPGHVIWSPPRGKCLKKCHRVLLNISTRPFSKHTVWVARKGGGRNDCSAPPSCTMPGHMPFWIGAKPLSLHKVPMSQCWETIASWLKKEVGVILGDLRWNLEAPLLIRGPPDICTLPGKLIQDKLIHFTNFHNEFKVNKHTDTNVKNYFC